MLVGSPHRTRVAVLATHPIQYFAPVFRELARRPELDVTVFFCSDLGVGGRLDDEFGVTFDWDVPVLEGYRHRFLSNLGRGPEPFNLLNPGIAGELLAGKFDALVIHGYTHLTEWLALAAARLARARIVLRSESNLLRARTRWQRTLKETPVRLFVGAAARAAYIGLHNRDYYLAYGMPRRKLVFAPYCVDNAFFQQQARHLRTRRKAVKAELGLPDDDRPVVLFCGKLAPVKQPALLLRAFLAVQQELPATLLFAGEGPLRGEIEQMAATRPDASVRITGFMNQSQIGRAYAAADLLVLPSASETWGLVVNEAMNFGIPCLVSDKVGCAHDLVQHGVNGYVFRAGDELDLAQQLRLMLSDGTRRKDMGRLAFETVQNWSVERCVDGLVVALTKGRAA